MTHISNLSCGNFKIRNPFEARFKLDKFWRTLKSQPSTLHEILAKPLGQREWKGFRLL
jgi:hypothetical protein